MSLGRAAPTADELELLRAALCPPEEAAAAWARWRAEHDVFHAPRRSHEVLPAVSANLPISYLGGDAQRLAGLRRNTWVNNQLVFDSLGAALDVLHGVGVEPIVVKGASLVARVNSLPGTRRMADADIVVGPDSFDLALAALTRSGWAVRGSWVHAADLAGPSGGGVDVHRWVVFPRFSRQPENSWWGRSFPDVIAGRVARRLPLAEELVLTIVHGLLTSSPSTIRWPLDVSAILAVVPPLDRHDFWLNVTTAARDVGLGPIVADGLALCAEEFALGVPESTMVELRARRLDPFLALQWALHRAGAKPPMRVRRFVDMERAAGRRPSSVIYARRRWSALREHGVKKVLSYRIGHLRRAAHVVTSGLSRISDG